MKRISNTLNNNKIYAASDNAIFSLDLQTNELNELTTINGLSGETISTIYYSDIYELLLIGYENGLIEVAFDDDDDILFSARISLKKYFTELITTNNPKKLGSLLTEHTVDVVLLDMNYRIGYEEGKEGIYWLKYIKEVSPEEGKELTLSDYLSIAKKAFVRFGE